MQAQAVNLAGKPALFCEHWAPKTVASFKGHDVRVAKGNGRFVAHARLDTDDFILVLRDRLTIDLRDGFVTPGPGEALVAPRGAERCPVADDATEPPPIEPSGTPHTGDPTTAVNKAKI